MVPGMTDVTGSTWHGGGGGFIDSLDCSSTLRQMVGTTRSVPRRRRCQYVLWRTLLSVAHSCCSRARSLAVWQIVQYVCGRRLRGSTICGESRFVHLNVHVRVGERRTRRLRHDQSTGKVLSTAAAGFCVFHADCQAANRSERV